MKTVPTKILDVNPDIQEKGKLRSIVRILKRDGVIVYPTDTFYGLGASCFSLRAIERIYHIKKRELSKPLPIIIADLKPLGEIVRSIPPAFRAVAEKFWPGPLTLILEASPGLPKELLGFGRTVAIRIPDFPWLQGLVRLAGFPLIATSANISGAGEIASPDRLKEIFSRKVDLIVAAGESRGTLPSTVVDLSSGKPRLLREGAVPVSRLRKHLDL